jgi:hypothetical protein
MTNDKQLKKDTRSQIFYASMVSFRSNTFSKAQTSAL